MEVFYEGQWRRVAVVSNDTAAVARVACRQAGYLYMEGTQSFEEGSGPVWLLGTCTGSEERLEQCEHWEGGFSLCSLCVELGVRCGCECA